MQYDPGNLKCDFKGLFKNNKIMEVQRALNYTKITSVFLCELYVSVVKIFFNKAEAMLLVFGCRLGDQ